MHDQIPTASRLAARVILIDQDRRVLYLRAVQPRSGRTFWVMPGGGLEPGETFEEAACREAQEESGCSFRLGPYVWFRRHRYLWDGRYLDQYERFFVAQATDTAFAPVQPDGYVSDHRWWSLDEMRASREEFVPRNIRNILAPILVGEYPEIPFDCGV
jgi:8-oxo-dGTP pyrophosphatase MutT (NUDIX family)